MLYMYPIYHSRVWINTYFSNTYFNWISWLILLFYLSIDWICTQLRAPSDDSLPVRPALVLLGSDLPCPWDEQTCRQTRNVDQTLSSAQVLYQPNSVSIDTCNVDVQGDVYHKCSPVMTKGEYQLSHYWLMLSWGHKFSLYQTVYVGNSG